MTDTKSRSILLTTVLISAALLVGRVSGFIRETILAARFGVSAETDVAVLLLTLPDFLVGLLLSGGLSAALLPAMKKLDLPERVLFLQKSALLAFLLFAVFALCLAIWPSVPFALLAPGLSADVAQTYAPHLAISAIAIPIAALSGVSVSFLNTQGKFFIAGLGTLSFNTVLCLYLLVFFSTATPLMGFAIAIVVAALARWGLQLAQMPNIFRPGKPENPVLLRPVLRGFLNGLLAYSIMFGVPYLFRSVYGFGGEGNLAVFNFALKLFELPAVLLIAPLVTVMLPRLSGLAEKDSVAFHQTLSAGLFAGISLALIALGYGLVFGDAAAQVIFARGEMQAGDVDRVAAIAKVMFVALPFFAISQLAASGLNALGKTSLVLRNALISLALVAVALLAVPSADSETLTIWVLVGFHAALAALNLRSLSRVAQIDPLSILKPAMKPLTLTAILTACVWLALQKLAPDLGNYLLVGLSLPFLATLLGLNSRALGTLRRIRNT
ncbi:MAG: hypothetical protein GY952_05060 [Rhodobacteraceae bacterium]|nr:hypothetical protein [Paracoccaceae bacterium]